MAYEIKNFYPLTSPMYEVGYDFDTRGIYKRPLLGMALIKFDEEDELILDFIAWTPDGMTEPLLEASTHCPGFLGIESEPQDWAWRIKEVQADDNKRKLKGAI